MFSDEIGKPSKLSPECWTAANWLHAWIPHLGTHIEIADRLLFPVADFRECSVWEITEPSWKVDWH